MRLLVSTIYAVALLAVGSVTAEASVQLSGELPVVSSVEGPVDAPLDPAAAYDQTLDRYLVAWLQHDGAGGTVNVWARFLTPDGTPVGAPFLAGTVGTGIEGRDALAVEVAYDSVRREYLVLMIGHPNASTPDATELYGQWLDDQGERLGRAVAISSISAGQVRQPAVVHDAPRDRFVIAYQADRPSIPLPTTLIQVVRAGNIGAPHAPFAAVTATSPSVVVRPRDGAIIVASANGAASSEMQVAVLDRALVTVETATWPAGTIQSGPQLQWHGGQDVGLLSWSAGSQLSGVTLLPDGRPGAPAPWGTLASPTGLTLVPLERSSRPWLALTTSPAADGVAAQLVGADGSSGGGVGFPIQEARASGYGAPSTPAALDRTRQWVLVPYGVRNGASRAVVARIAAAPAARDSQPTALTDSTPALRCPAGAQLFTPAAGSACAPLAVSAFTVSPMTDRKRRKLVGLAVSPTTRASRVRVECVASCGRLRPVLKIRGRPRATDLLFGRWRLPAGALVEVRIEQPDRTTRFRRFLRVRRFPFLETRDHACRLPIGVTASC